jgi:hypothetical protein
MRIRYLKRHIRHYRCVEEIGEFVIWKKHVTGMARSRIVRIATDSITYVAQQDTQLLSWLNIYSKYV